MGGIARRNRRPGARIQQIVADLGGVEDARIDDPVERWGVADRGNAAKAGLALLPQSLESRNRLAENGLGRKAAVAAVHGDVIVQLEQVDPVELQTLQARLQRCGYCRTNAAALAVGNADFGTDEYVGLQALQDAPEIALGFAVAIHRRGVEVVDAKLDGTRDRPLLVGRIAAHHQTPNGAAAEPEDRYRETGAAECPCFHRFLRCSGVRPGSKPALPEVSILPAPPRFWVMLRQPGKGRRR